jgi:hypothetical protein
MTPDNAMVSRRIVFQTAKTVTLVEVWDTTHPDSPYAPSWWGPGSRRDNARESPIIRAVTMPWEHYDSIRPPLKGTGDVAELEKENARLRFALADARDALRNDFEPDNQSRAYQRADAALRETICK